MREWIATPDPTGQEKGRYKLSPLRSLHLSSPPLPFDPSHALFSCFFPVRDKEIYMFFKNVAVGLERTSPFEDKGGEGRVEVDRVWDFFEGGGGGGGGEGGGMVWCVFCIEKRSVGGDF